VLTGASKCVAISPTCECDNDLALAAGLGARPAFPLRADGNVAGSLARRVSRAALQIRLAMGIDLLYRAAAYHGPGGPTALDELRVSPRLVNLDTHALSRSAARLSALGRQANQPMIAVMTTLKAQCRFN
jgi:hypothetical protein